MGDGSHLLEMRETRARVASCSRTLGFVQRSRETGSSSQKILLIVANFVRGGHGSARRLLRAAWTAVIRNAR